MGAILHTYKWLFYYKHFIDDDAQIDTEIHIDIFRIILEEISTNGQWKYVSEVTEWAGHGAAYLDSKHLKDFPGRTVMSFSQFKLQRKYKASEGP